MKIWKKVLGWMLGAMMVAGMLPVAVTLEYGNGTTVDLDLGPTARVACAIGFLSELAKVAPQNDTGYAPEDKTTLAPPEPKPWEM